MLSASVSSRCGSASVPSQQLRQGFPGEASNSLGMRPANACLDPVVADLRAGRPIIILGEGSFCYSATMVFAARLADAKAINFLARTAKGVIALALSQKRADELGLEVHHRLNSHESTPMFAASIEARYGVSTGISANDRAHTIAIASDDRATADGLSSPGHIIPIVAKSYREGSDLGLAEACVRLVKHAGLGDCAVLAAMLDDQGEELTAFSARSFAARDGYSIRTIGEINAALCLRTRIRATPKETSFSS